MTDQDWGLFSASNLDDDEIAEAVEDIRDPDSYPPPNVYYPGESPNKQPEQVIALSADETKFEIKPEAKDERQIGFYDQESLFKTEVVESSGKTLEALEYSRAKRIDILRLFNGHLPQSIMVAERKSRESDLAAGSYDESGPYADHEVKGFRISSKGCANGALSAFPQNIGRSTVLFYSNEGDTVFDPFAGHNSRMELCINAGRNYVGCDLSHNFMEWNRKERENLLRKHPNRAIELHEIDSRYINDHVKGGPYDFTLTSPPYYDIEYYGDEPGQLGKQKTYQDFLNGMSFVAAANFNQLKAGAFCCWFINDFRRKKIFHPYHIDIFNILYKVGFEPWDVMIVDLGASFRAAFAQQVVESQILPKRHEYGVVMRKPGWKD